MFEAQFTLAAATNAKVVVLENVDGVATIECGVALANLIILLQMQRNLAIQIFTTDE